MAAFQAVFALGNLHQLGAIAAEVKEVSRYYLFSQRSRLHLWMGLHYHRFIKCNFIGKLVSASHRFIVLTLFL
jgi:hypothetical protein